MSSIKFYFKFTNIICTGKVPVLDTGSEIITESLVISDYLDEKYPTPPLHPSSPELKQKHKNLVEIVGNLTKVYHNFVWGKEEMNLIDKFEELKPQVEQLENELEKQGSKYIAHNSLLKTPLSLFISAYFGGNNPGMLDYMTWPWAERLPIVKLLYTGELPTTTDSFPRLKLWYNNMLTQKPVQQTVFKPEAHYKLMQLYRKDEPVDYDQLFAAATSK